MANNKIIVNLPDGFAETIKGMLHSEVARTVLHLLQQAVKDGTIPVGYVQLVCNFTGSGDSTDGMEWSFVVDGTITSDPRPFDWGNDVNETIDDWVWNMSTDAEPGWYNNEGGYGNLTINFIDGVVHYEQYNYVTTEEQCADDILINLPGETIERTGFEDNYQSKLADEPNLDENTKDKARWDAALADLNDQLDKTP